MSRTWTAGARRNLDDAPARSSAFPADLAHPRSNKYAHGLDLSKERAGKLAEGENIECAARERHVNPTVHGTSSSSSRAARGTARAGIAGVFS